ncbi:methionine aminotransferase [Ascidiimonas aurantiaca]|uniref:methionine aminotransferase n=1 Tax=Ascidiimonas aurantiaca TaxID=1685432 RepID=UPI0030ECA71B
MPETRIKTASKLPWVETTIFTKMSRLAKKHNAINLSQGFPDFPSDPKLSDLVTRAMKDGYNQYAPMPGLLQLREVISEKIAATHLVNYDPLTEITITVGATQAIFTAIATFVNPGDEVILLKPAYDCYEPAIALQGGVSVPVQMHSPYYKVNWNEVRAKIRPQTRMLIINTPHNPTGTILTHEDMLELESILKHTNILLLSDEVYEHIIFDGATHESACRFPYLAERAFICASFGKTFHNTGWKTGYCVAPATLMHEFRKSHQFAVFCANHPMQKAFADYLKEPSHYLSLPDFYEKKRNRFRKLLKGSRFEILETKGTYFQLLDYSAISTQKDIDFANWLVKIHGIASIPVSVFHENGEDLHLLRFCFAKENDTLERAASVLRGL